MVDCEMFHGNNMTIVWLIENQLDMIWVTWLTSQTFSYDYWLTMVGEIGLLDVVSGDSCLV